MSNSVLKSRDVTKLPFIFQWFTLTGLQSRGDFNSRFGNYRTTQPLNDRVIEANFDRPSGAIRPSPNGEAIMMMMMELMNMTMEMMTQETNPQSMPMMLMDRSALSPIGNIRDMPLMMMSMMQNVNVPGLSGQTRERLMRMGTGLPMLNENILNMPIMSMMPMSRDAIVPNLNGNVRQRQRPMMSMMPQQEQSMSSLDRSIQQMPMMMSTLNDPNIPNIGGSMSVMMPMQQSASIQSRPGLGQDIPMMMGQIASIPTTPNLVDALSQRMAMLRNSNVPNLDGNVRGRGSMTEPNVPVFNRNVFRVLSSVMGRSRDGPNLDGNVRRSQRLAFPVPSPANQPRMSPNNNDNNNNNNRNMNNNNNNNNGNKMKNRMNEMNNNMMNMMKNVPWNVWR